jgi:hypothetical protein
MFVPGVVLDKTVPPPQTPSGFVNERAQSLGPKKKKKHS